MCIAKGIVALFIIIKLLSLHYSDQLKIFLAEKNTIGHW